MFQLYVLLSFYGLRRQKYAYFSNQQTKIKKNAEKNYNFLVFPASGLQFRACLNFAQHYFEFNEALRACLNFPPKEFYSASFEIVFGLFSRCRSSRSPLRSSCQQKNILENIPQNSAEQNLNRLLYHTTNFSDADWTNEADSYVFCNAIENKIGADFADGRGF